MGPGIPSDGLLAEPKQGSVLVLSYYTGMKGGNLRCIDQSHVSGNLGNRLGVTHYSDEG